MIIEKKQTLRDSCAFQWSYFPAAREGLACILRKAELQGKTILLPAYIGYSTREGSGVFDPVMVTKTPYEFYRLDGSLNIDVPGLQTMIRKNPKQVLLLIHYFGFKDKNLDRIKKFARNHGMVIIEDYAHAFYAFCRAPSRDFDYAIFSLHKMFPEVDGGMVLCDRLLEGRITHPSYDLFRYNLAMIMERRRKNYAFILSAVRSRGRKAGLRPLRPVLGEAVPQTFPVLLPTRETRDRLYFAMNEAGYGVVSLYHELISPVDRSFETEWDIADRILNLPVHQDADPQQLSGMMRTMFAELKKG